MTAAHPARYVPACGRKPGARGTGFPAFP